jgi:bla regulator protein blaR1
MNVLALLLLFATYANVVIHDHPDSYVDGDSSRNLSSLGKHYAYFERDGVGYAIQDPATLAALQRILEPQRELGRQQAELGARQAEIGAKQAAVGARQAKLGAEQIGARGARGERASRLAERQRELAEEQSELADRQQPLARQQRVLAGKQREAARIARPKMEKIFDDAVRSGLATRR